MKGVLAGLEPEPIWRHFEQLCAIPRPSRHEERVAKHVVTLARSWGLTVERDAVGNVVVRKPASRGLEDRRTVIMQCHLDMVPQKAADSAHDFVRDPIRPRVEGTTVRATGTTLGADDGIGISVALAVLESRTLQHGPLEALFTVDEESGMSGARGLEPGLLKGDILLNLDSEDEGELCIGCAGGADLVATLAYREVAPAASSTAWRVEVSGLRGGHSGVDIHLGRANANKVLTRLLVEARRVADVRVASFQGGNLRNAIPRSAEAVITAPRAKAGQVSEAIGAMAAQVKAEFHAVDPGLQVAITEVKPPRKVMSKSTTSAFLNAVYACPHGCLGMVRDMPTVTETSTNLAIVTAGKGKLQITNMLRSSVESRKADVSNTLRAVFDLLGAKVVVSGGYPGWQPNVTSPVLAQLKDLYQELFGTPAVVTATHGGLECGIIRAVYPSVDAISIGPTVRGAHTPEEYVDVPSVERFWQFLVEALKRIPRA